MTLPAQLAIRGGIVLLAMVGVVGIFWGIENMPDGENAWGTADLEEPIGRFTVTHFRYLQNNPEACLAALAVSDMVYTPVEPRSEREECRWQAGVQVNTSNLSYASPQPPVASCALAATLYLWEREIVAPAAARHLDAEVEEVLHYGTYSCRQERGSQSGRWSQHAAANAIDISGFRLADGRIISLRHWGNDTPEAAFLEDVRDQSCTLFTGVLGPDYNTAHSDHFHLDLGPWEICS